MTDDLGLAPGARKLLLLTYGCNVGGCEMHLLHLARGLVARGWRVHLAYFRERISDSRSLADDFAGLGVELHDLGDVSWWDPRGWRSLAALMRRERFAIVHSHLPGPDLVGGVVSWWLALGHKRIVSVHNQRHRARLDYPRWAMRRSWSSADGLVAISHAVREHLERRVGVDSGRATVIPYGLPLAPRDGEPFLRQTLGLATEPLLLNVGRLVPQKGQLCLIDAMPEILARVPDCHLAIVGHAEDGYADVLARRIAAHGLDARVHLLGYREMGARAMAEADVFVFPSLWEGFGLAVIEAMRAGVPVVCSAIDPLQEIVGDGGLLVPPGDVEQLAARVVDVLASPDVARLLAEQGRRRAQARFDVDRMVDRTHRYYLHTLRDGAVA